MAALRDHTNVRGPLQRAHEQAGRDDDVFSYKRRGFGLIGWQGVVPKAARRMGGDVSDLLTKDLLNVTEVLRRVDPETLSQRLCTPAFVGTW